MSGDAILTYAICLVTLGILAYQIVTFIRDQL